MDLEFTPEQDRLRRTLGDFLPARYTFEARRATIESASGWSPEIWSVFASELDILQPHASATGGASADAAVRTMIVMEALGGSLVVEPFVETVVLAGGLLSASGAGFDEHLARIAAGELLFAFGWAEPGSRHGFERVETRATRDGAGWRLNGRKSVVIAAPLASQLIVTARTGGGVADEAGISLFLIDKSTSGVSTQDYPTIDGRRTSDLLFEDVALPASALIGGEGEALPLVGQVGDRAIAAICAEAVGVMRRMLSDTVAHTRERRQFRQALSGFQALQHRMVDMFLQIEMAEAATLRATLSLDAEPAERARAVSAAKVTVGRACRFVGQNAIQLHGGLGMTDATPVTHYFRRAMAIEAEFGSVDYHLNRFADLAEAA